MTKRPGRNHTAAFKAEVELEAVREEKTVVEIAEITGVRPNPVTRWKKQLLERTCEAFEKERPMKEVLTVREFNAKISQLMMENDFSAGALGKLQGTSAKR